MANTSSFLFQGAVPVAAPTSSSTTQQFPLWMQQSEYNLANAAQQLAQQPYQQFRGPQVASPSGQTKQAWQLAGQNVGNWNPYLQQAASLTGQAAAPITAADISTFMNPYESYVTGALNKNLMDNILPGVQSQFVSAGQAASPQQAQIAGQAVYNTQQAAGQALAQNYAGALSALQQQRAQEQAAGAQYGQLGQTTAQLGATDVSQLAAAGQGQDVLSQANINAALNNWQQQQQWPYQQLGFASDIVRGLPVQTSTSTQGTYYPQAYGASPFAAALGGAQAGSSGGLFAEGGAVHEGALGRVARARRSGRHVSHETPRRSAKGALSRRAA